MSSSPPQALTDHLSPSLLRLARERPLVALGIAGTLSGLSWAVRDYTRWKALGPGGVPFNPLGWLRVQLLTPIAASQRHITDTAELDDLIQQIAKEEGEKAVFRSLSLGQRSGRKPTVRGIVPQRQIDEFGPKAFTEEINAYLVALALKYPTLLRVAPAAWKGGQIDALFLCRYTGGASSAPSLSSRILAKAVARAEIAHVHPTDGSLHVLLSPADAAEVIRKSWGVRHRLAGRVSALPSTFVLLYAPRDTEEVSVVKKIIAASVEYVTGLSNVK